MSAIEIPFFDQVNQKKVLQTTFFSKAELFESDLYLLLRPAGCMALLYHCYLQAIC